MYKLESGDKSNAKHLMMLETYTQLKPLIQRNHTNYNVKDTIFSKNFDENMYDDLVTALTIGDELSVPISEEEANVLFFTLNVNISNGESRIRSIAKAYLFFNEFEHDYSKVTFIDTKSSIIHMAKIFYHDVIPGVAIQYKIPFYVVNSSSGYHFTIAECDTYTMLINDKVNSISRKSLYHLVDGNYARPFRNHEEVMNSINTSIDILVECLTDAEFVKVKVEYPFSSSMILEFDINELSLFAWDTLNEEYEDWKAINNTKYVLNKEYENIVPLVPKGPNLEIYIV